MDDRKNDDDVDQNIGSFWSSSPAGRMDTKYSNRPDFEIVRNANPDMSDVPSDAIVTDEDTAALRKAHRRADRIMEYAADVSLIASFHYKKRNFHLVKLLEPIFIIGKRIDDIKGFLLTLLTSPILGFYSSFLKGYYFTLLDDEEGSRVVPILEDLLSKRNDANPRVSSITSDKKEQITASNKKVAGSRRRWSNRRNQE